MFKRIVSLLFLSSALVFAGCSQKSSTNETGTSTDESVIESSTNIEESTTSSEITEKPSSLIALTSNDAIKEAKTLLWQEYLEEIQNDEVRNQEVKERVMHFGDVSMKYGILVKGKADENGYPVYIALHGGGSSDTPDLNDSQWSMMATYYSQSIKRGIYIFPRGIRDTWDTHANPESFPLYDRLIENILAFYDADPNRVYLLGFSAGGDGVYMITPRMTDRFAAANMSAGHPNGINLTNLYNMPIQLQVGMHDSAYNRNTVTAEYDAVLANLATTYGGGYVHNTFIHVQYGHNFYDNRIAKMDEEVLADPAAWLATGDTTSIMTDTRAVTFLNQYTRDALPKRVIWDLTTRANMREVQSNYWLQASYDVTEGVIIASYDTEANSITIEENTTNGPVTVLISEDMLDVFAPITVNTPSGSYEINVTPDYELLKSTTYERGDANYQFVASIVIE